MMEPVSASLSDQLQVLSQLFPGGRCNTELKSGMPLLLFIILFPNNENWNLVTMIMHDESTTSP